jgi:hypothetical protein
MEKTIVSVHVHYFCLRYQMVLHIGVLCHSFRMLKLMLPHTTRYFKKRLDSQNSQGQQSGSQGTQPGLGKAGEWAGPVEWLLTAGANRKFPPRKAGDLRGLQFPHMSNKEEQDRFSYQPVQYRSKGETESWT